MKDKDIEKELNKLADTWVIDGGFETFTGDDEMIARSNFKADIASLLTTQKEEFIKIIDKHKKCYLCGMSEPNPHGECHCSFDENMKYFVVNSKEVKAELEKEDR